jgi:hypothetical protein
MLAFRRWDSERQIQQGDGGWHGDYYLVMNKGGGPRVPTRAKTIICRMPILNDLAGVLCYRRLRRRTPLGDLCLEIAGSCGIRFCAPVFFSLVVWYEKECCEDLLAVTIMAHAFFFHDEVN